MDIAGSRHPVREQLIQLIDAEPCPTFYGWQRMESGELTPLAGFCHTLRTKLLPASEYFEAPAIRHVPSVSIPEAVADSSFSHCRL